VPKSADHITTKEAAEILGVSTQAIVQWANAGKLRHFRTLGNHRRFARSEIEAIAAEQAARLESA
jgi:excisionase family DNA binding protein